MGKQTLPEWVLKHKKPGTQVVQIRGNYYLYKVTSKWDREKGRARKVTERYLGKITEEGLIKPRHERIEESLKRITVKEYGASKYIVEITRDIQEYLREEFPEGWREIYVFSVMRLMHNSVMKTLSEYYNSSHLSEEIRGARVSPKTISKVLRGVGRERGRIVRFLRNFLVGGEYEVIDLTHVFSYSEDVISTTLGYNSGREYIPQINLVMVFSVEREEPVYFRVVPGSIRDVTAFKRTIEEASLRGAVIVADKGFYSKENIRYLEREGLKYIIPLRRNSRLIDYRVIEGGKREGFEGYFLFEKRVIWYQSRREGRRRVVLYLDEELKAEEEKDLVGHIEEGRFSLEKYYGIQHRLGTIAVITNTDFSAQKVYEMLKGRVKIEQCFDTFKDLLYGDRLYLRDDAQIEGWMLVNFLALVMYYRIYRRLCDTELLKKYSVKDVIVHLSRIYKLKISGKWVLSEVPKTSKKLLDQLGLDLLHIT